jgi:hypothetical protein
VALCASLPFIRCDFRYFRSQNERAGSLAGRGVGRSRSPHFSRIRIPSRREAALRLDAAIYHPDLGEFVLPYEVVRTASDPDQMILDLFQSTYEMGATLTGWDRASLERPDPLHRKGAEP